MTIRNGQAFDPGLRSRMTATPSAAPPTVESVMEQLQPQLGEASPGLPGNGHRDLSSLADGERIECCYVVRDRSRRPTKRGGEWLALKLSDRSGSDKLRARIIAQERVQLADAPWYGHGPGTAKVSIRDLEFFFHNSYLATRQEGGWAALLLVLTLLAFTFPRLSARSRRGDMGAAGAQAAIIAVAAMAITLGEVLLDNPMAIAVGFALGHALTPEPQLAQAETPDG